VLSTKLAHLLEEVIREMDDKVGPNDGDAELSVREVRNKIEAMKLKRKCVEARIIMLNHRLGYLENTPTEAVAPKPCSNKRGRRKASIFNSLQRLRIWASPIAALA
jgi:hypothetical protein